jgi:hypothetical protein
MTADTGTARQVVARRRHHGDWTEAEILAIARRSEFMVWTYRWRHEKLRKLTRRMCKDGKLVMVMRNRDQFFYRTPKEK